MMNFLIVLSLGLIQIDSYEDLITQNRSFWTMQLNHGSKELRILGLQRLSEMRDPETVVRIVGVLSDAEPEVRFEAVKALTNFANEDALRFLKDHLAAEKDPYIKSESRRGIKFIEDFLKKNAPATAPLTP